VSAGTRCLADTATALDLPKDVLAMGMSKLRRTRNLQFWSFQLVGWSGWVVLLIMRDLSFVPIEYMVDRIGVFVLDAIVGMVLTSGLRYFYRCVWESSVPIRIAAVLFGSLGTSYIWQPIKVLITSTEIGSAVDLSDYGLISFSSVLPFSFSLLLIWSVIYFCIKYYQLFQFEKEKSLRSEALAHAAQLRMLRYQLNPHFLFNTLNAISTLVLQREAESANLMLTRLSKFLRYSLESDALEKVTLAHEIASVKLYLDIEKVRFEERMKIDLNIAPEADLALVPSMLLQPVIENSIKYAIARKEKGGLIEISANVVNDKLHIVVADDGPGFPGVNVVEKSYAVASSGVGLKNIRDRLTEIYGDDHQLDFSKRLPVGCKVTVIIPYETKQ
jgi:two-component system LytT family sensor kinase